MTQRKDIKDHVGRMDEETEEAYLYEILKKMMGRTHIPDWDQYLKDSITREEKKLDGPIKD